MISQLLEGLGQFCIKIVLLLGYPGLILLMAMESMIFPLPSELVMPFAGFLAGKGEFNFWLVVLFSSLGSIIGSSISYYAGKYGGNRFVLKFGRYLLLDAANLKKTEKWFAKSGDKTIFISRFIPVVRHLISIPAGIGKMNLKKFLLYTFCGAALWNSFLAYLGYILGENWGIVRQYSEYISVPVAIILAVAAVYFVYRHIKNRRTRTKE